MAKKIVYIAGYSRSGSTLLDILLASHENIVGTGELAYLFDDWLNDNRICTCGERYGNCLFWKDLQLPQGMSYEDAIKVVRVIESRASVNKLVKNSFEPEVVEQYKAIQTALYNFVFEKSGKQIIIDSSKSSRDMAGRFYALSQYTDFDVYVIQLIKNGLTIVKSYVEKGRNWAMEGHGKNDRFLAARSSVGWLLANKNAERLGKMLPHDRFVQMHYEDLVKNPKAFFLEIGRFLGEDFTEIQKRIDDQQAFKAGHNVGGNRLRLEKEIKLIPSTGVAKIKIDPLSKFTFEIISGRLNKHFRY